MTVTACSFKGDEQLFFTQTGQVESTSGKYCLEASAVTQDGQAYADKCQSDVMNRPEFSGDSVVWFSHAASG